MTHRTAPSSIPVALEPIMQAISDSEWKRADAEARAHIAELELAEAERRRPVPAAIRALPPCVPIAASVGGLVGGVVGAAAGAVVFG